MFKSKNINSLLDPNAIYNDQVFDLEFHHENNFMHSNFMEAPLQEHEKEFFAKQDEFIVLTDEDDQEEAAEENKDSEKVIQDKQVNKNNYSEKNLAMKIENHNNNNNNKVEIVNQVDNKENNT